MKNSILPVIAGPTASGKTALAVEVCRRIGGEIISADSMQVYQHLTIGTAKPTAVELEGIPCHLIDFISPDDQYNLGRFVNDATRCLKEIRSRGKIPVICGGTGMYIRGLLHGVFDGGEPELQIRAELEKQETEMGLPHLYAELQQVDPASAARYGRNDRQRIIRALEVWRSSGRPFSEYHTQDLDRPSIPSLIFILHWPREELYRRINLRVDDMVEAGLLDEVKYYLEQGFRTDNPALNALGYAELIDHVQGNLALEEALEVMKRKSRNYAKRQETWFRRIPDAVRLDAVGRSVSSLADEVIAHWEKTAG